MSRKEPQAPKEDKKENDIARQVFACAAAPPADDIHSVGFDGPLAKL
jgi:hypothetical protein